MSLHGNESDPLLPKTPEKPSHQKYLDPIESISRSPHGHQQQIKSSHVFIEDKAYGWLPGELISIDQKRGIATVLCENRSGNSEKKEVKVKLEHYGPSKALPMQCVDSEGSTVVVEDMRDLPYSNEASILYNLKDRYEKECTPYTRATNSVMVAINPYDWIDGLYSERVRQEYADEIVWKASQRGLALAPHIYEISSMAMRGILTDGADQTIVVSGESGSGKTVSSKILMAHLATFHQLKAAYVVEDSIRRASSADTSDYDVQIERKEYKSIVSLMKDSVTSFFSFVFQSPENNDNKKTNLNNTEFDIEAQVQTLVVDEEPEELKQKNLIVQRVIDSNPLLEAFGNAKTCLNDNSSRFSRYSKLQFHVEDGVAHPTANIAGSTCHTFLLEKSRVVSHDMNNDERTFHIFYQLMKAPNEEKENIWKGLKGKCAESFKYIGGGDGSDEFTNEKAWRHTISALNTIGVDGSELQTLLMAVCIVLQLGNIVFIPNPENEEEAVIENEEELQILSEMIGIPSNELSHCLTHKTMTTNRDTFQVPLKVDASKSSCDALAKECYRALFDWLVDAINESTCADTNYKRAHRVSRYSCIAVLDICGFECFEINGFEQLLINHTNERLQKTFTETMIDAVMEEYEFEGIPLEEIEHEDNETVIRFFEGKMGLISLLNEECILPRSSDASFVKKIYATHDKNLPSSKLFFEKNFQLAKHSKTLFGIRHFAKDVTYDATGFLMKNKDTLPSDVVSCAVKSTNHIIRSGLSLHESSTPKKKISLVGTSLWSSFERQMTTLFTQIKRTRVWFVRCIIPNNDKQPFSLDLKCTLAQLRSVGLLTALKMSHASFPNKQAFDHILRRFWFLGSFGDKYAFGKVEGSEVEIREDCEKLLGSVLSGGEEGGTGGGGDASPYETGQTKVYFREGSLEELESKRAKAFDKNASKIQARVRGILARRDFESMKKDLQQVEIVDQSCGICMIQ